MQPREQHGAEPVTRDVIVIGTSAGGVSALASLVAELPSDLQASVLIVMHVSPDSPSLLPDILARAGKLRVGHARDGAALEIGAIHVAPPDHHLLVEAGRTRLVRGPRENRHRPAVDPLFRSAARAYGPQAIGVILTGGLDDGTQGLLAVKAQGGIAIVQDPADAAADGMPRSALRHVRVDHCVPLAEIAPLLVRLTREPAAVTTPGANGASNFEQGGAIAAQVPSPFSCPDCNGVLSETVEDQMLHFRCRVGHAFSAETLLAQQSDGIEAALWAGVRALEESADLARRMALRLGRGGANRNVARLVDRARIAENNAARVRTMLTSSDPAPHQPPDGPE
jgi:two-component system, chemotaxis family, protein-glutamate methylesterase/glutaminase